MTCQVYQFRGHWEAMLVLPEAVKATVRMVVPEISFLTAVHQARNGRVTSRTWRRQNAWGLLSQAVWTRGKKEGRRWGTSHAGVARNTILGSQWRVGSTDCVTLEWCQLSSSVVCWSGKVRTE